MSEEVKKVRKPKSLRTVLVKKVFKRFTEEFSWEFIIEKPLSVYLKEYLSFDIEVLLDGTVMLADKNVWAGQIIFKNEEGKPVVISFHIKASR